MFPHPTRHQPNRSLIMASHTRSQPHGVDDVFPRSVS